ncbi:MAG: hypothetical protein NW215_01010 [Hyphomicrobiales bacterium]|nr:hypothetical protein [Hyphomicrobiales bacterium]
MGKTFAQAVAGVALALAFVSSPGRAQEAPSDLQTYQNERFGFTLRYPALFEPAPPPETGDGQTFITEDGRAKIVTYAALNTQAYTLSTYRRTLLANYDGYNLLDYQPRGKTWFVLSGFRGDRIFYEKVMFSCGDRVINVLAISFPTEEKPVYEPIVEQIEDDFKPGRGRDTPPNC